MLTTTPVGLSGLIETFSDINSPTFERDHIVSMELPYEMLYLGKPVTKTRCHKLLVDNFTAAFVDLRDSGLSEDVKEYCGIYNARHIRGMPRYPSVHSWGCAVDLCCSQYRLGSAKRMDDAIVAIFKKHGFVYGGDFTHRKDPQHFQFVSNY